MHTLSGQSGLVSRKTSVYPIDDNQNTCHLSDVLCIGDNLVSGYHVTKVGYVL